MKHRYHHYCYSLNSNSTDRKEGCTQTSDHSTHQHEFISYNETEEKSGGYKKYYNNCNNGHHVLSAYLLYLGSVPNALFILSHLTLLQVLSSECYQSHHFRDAEIKAQSENSQEVAQLGAEPSDT